MTRPLVYLAIVVVLAAGAYVAWIRTPLSAENAGRGVPVSMNVETAVYSEESESYTINAEYPRFGVAPIDSAVQSVVDNAIAAFKSYPADVPSVDSVPKNSQDIYYGDVYTGSDYVSVELLISEYTGGAHPNTVITGVNVMPDGTSVTLTDALTLIGKSLQQVASEADAELSTRLGEAYFPEGAVPVSDNYSTFLISETSVTFVFNAYQVGPYAAGSQEVAFERVR